MKSILLSVALLASLCAYPQNGNLFDELDKKYINEDFEGCIALAKQIEQQTASRRDTVAANAFSNLGDAYYQVGDVLKAIAWQERERKLREELNLTQSEAYSTCLFNLANSYVEANRLDDAVTTAKALLSNDRKLFGLTDENYISSVISASDILVNADRTDDAEKLLATSARQQQKNSINQGILLSKLGDVYTLTSQFSRATRALDQSLKILVEKTGDRSRETTTAFLNLAILFMEQNKLPEAEEIFDRVLSTLSHEDADYGGTLNNQAIVYHRLGQLDKAKSNYKHLQTIDSVEIGTSHPDFAIALTNLGLVYIDEGNFQLAEKTLIRALDIQKKNNETRTVSYARKLNNLARVYQSTGLFDKAIKLYEQALQIFKAALGNESPELATTSFNLGTTHWKAGRPDTGIKFIRQSATIRATKLGKKHPKYAESAQKIAEYHWEKKQWKEARANFDEVFASHFFQIESTFTGLTEEEKARFYSVNIRPSIEKFDAFVLDGKAALPDLTEQMIDYNIAMKGSILYATEKVRNAILTSNDTVLISKFEQWQAQREQIAKAYSENTAPSFLDSLQRSTDRLEKELSRTSKVFMEHVVRKPITWRNVQKALGRNEVAVETIRFRSYSPANSGSAGDKVHYAFLIVAANEPMPRPIVLENGKDLEGKFVNFYRNSIKFTLEDQRSFDNFFRTLFDALPAGTERIYFSPDGVYNQINVNTIKMPDGRFLLDALDLRIVTNLKEIAEPKKKSSSQSSVLIGFPTFNLEYNSPAQQRESTRSLTRTANLSRSLRGGLLRYMRGEGSIATLPGTQIEIEKIAAIAKDAKVYTERNADEGLVKSVVSPRLLHIATHGYFLQEDEQLRSAAAQAYFPNPLLKSGIILAGAESFLKSGVQVNTAGDDGILTAYEAMNLSLDETDLVVLSACETGLGEIKNGEGVYGLQRAFKLAGAANLIMSLWSVDDAATQELMTTFYRERLNTNDNAYAFRAAQQQLKQKFPHPFYWGAFIFVGH